MKTFKVMVEFDRNHALDNGRDEYGKKVFEIKPSELTPECRKILSTVEVNKFDNAYDLTSNYSLKIKYDPISHFDHKVLRELLEQWDTQRKEIVADFTKGVQQFLDTPDADFIAPEPVKDKSYGYLEYQKTDIFEKQMRYDFDRDSRWELLPESPLKEKCEDKKQSILALLKKKNKKFKDEHQKQLEIKDEQRKENERIAKQAKNDQFNEWLLSLGTKSQQRRHERGLLDKTEILSAVRSDIFKPLSGFDKFKKIKRSDVDKFMQGIDDDQIVDEHYDEYHNTEYDFGEMDKAPITDDEFELLEQIETAADKIRGEVKTELKRHVGGDNDKWYCEANSVLVTVSSNGWVFSREYAIGTVKPFDD